MNNKTKILYAKLIILILCLCIIIRIFNLVLSKYESQSSGVAQIDIAFYLFKEDYQTMTLNLAKVFPQNNSYIYTFSVGNTDGDKQAEIDLSYDLTIRTTTNLPLTFELYMNNSTASAMTSNVVEKDEDGTYFRTITSETLNLAFDTPTTNVYQLVVNFPANYNTENYQSILELLEITVESRQAV